MNLKYNIRGQSVEAESSNTPSPRPTPPEGTIMSSNELNAMLKRSGKALKTKSILVIEDDRESRFMVTAMLSMGEYMVQVADSRDQASQYLKENTPDIILLDVFMPGMALEQFVSEVQARSPVTRIVLMSAGPQLREDAAKLGVDWYIAKPFQHSLLLSVLRKCME